MPESDERSGLAKSIDALFAQPRPTPPAEEPPAGEQEAHADSVTDPEPPLPAEAPPPLPADSEPPPLPTEGIPAPLSGEASPPPLPADVTPPPSEATPPPLPSEAGAEPEPEDAPPPPLADVPLELDPFEPMDAPPLEAAAAAEPSDEPPPLAAESSDAEREPGMVAEPGDPASEETEADERAAAPLPSELTEAVDQFLAGHPGAGAKVEDIAAEMRERLALDPLADAVERLVHAADEAGDDPAIELARKIINPAVASRLVQRMSHEEDEEARNAYLDLSRRLGMVMANAFKGALTGASDPRTRRSCYDGLIALGDTSRPVIEAMLEDDNRFLVQNAVAILGEVGGDGALELVTSTLADTDPRVRREALSSLAKLGDEETGQLVLASLEDPSEKVRAAAAEAAGRLGVQRALRPMLTLLDDDELGDEEQIQVLRGLGALGDPGAVQAIEKRAVGSLFSKPATEVRVAAFRALHEIGTPHARELIQKAQDDKDPVVRTTVKALAQEE